MKNLNNNNSKAGKDLFESKELFFVRSNLSFSAI